MSRYITPGTSHYERARRLAECPLRSVSPLPFALDRTPVKVAVPIVRRPRGVRSTDR